MIDGGSLRRIEWDQAFVGSLASADLAIHTDIPLINDVDAIGILPQIDCSVARLIRVIAVPPIAVEYRNRGARRKLGIAFHQRAPAPVRGTRRTGRFLDQRDAFSVPDLFLADPLARVGTDIHVRPNALRCLSVAIFAWARDKTR